MEKSSSALDDSATSSFHTVFIDTSLDTHLALIVPHSDTVSDLKKKIMDEHPLCFPDVGGINIHALKVKRRAYFYHLSDSMFVRSAFHGVSKSWFLYVEASSVGGQSGNQYLGKPDAGDIVLQNPSDDMVDLIFYGPARKLSNIGDSSLKENNASARVSDKYAPHQRNVVPNNSLLNEDRAEVVICSMESGSKDITGDPCWISSSDASKRPGSEIKTDEVIGEGTAVPGEHIEHGKSTSENVELKDLHDMSLEEASPGHNVKIKQKTVRKDNNENSSKDGRVFICDSNKETSDPRIIYQCSLGDKQKGKNATWDHASTEFLKAVHLVTASPSSGKKKRKMKSSKSISQVVVTVPSFAEHGRGESSMDTEGVHKNLESEPDAAVIPGQNVQAAMASEPSTISMKEHLLDPVQEEGENNKVTSSYDGDGRTTDAVNVTNKSYSTEVAAVSVGERVRISQDHHAISAEGNYPFSVQEANDHCKDGVSKNENVCVNDGQKLGNHKIPSVAEEREMSKNNDSKAISSAKCTISNRDEINMNSKVVFTTDLVDTNGNVEPGRSSKKRKKSKKSRDNVATGTEHTSSPVGISSPEPHEPAHIDHSSDKSRKHESVVLPVVGNEEAKTTMSTFVLDIERETDNVIQNVLDALHDIGKNSANAENRDEKSRKKTKRKRSAAARNLPELQTKNKHSCKNATPSVNDITDVEAEASSELTKKAKLVKTSSKHQLNGSNWEHENNAAFETNPEGNNEGKPIQTLNGNFLSGFTDETNNRMEVSCESDRTIVNDKFVPSLHKHVIAASDKMLVEEVSKTKGADNLVRAGKDKKKLDAHSNGPFPALQGSLKLNENQGNGGEAQAQALKSSTVEPERSLTKYNADSSELQAKEKLQMVSIIEARALQSNEPDQVDRKLEEATRANAISTSRMHTHLSKNKETVAASSSSLGSSKNLLPRSKRGNKHQSHVERRKTSRNNDNGEVVNNSKPKKSLLAKSGTIFKDDSEGSSDDEGGPDNSDSSTIAPSDNSLSSNYSDVDSTARQNGLRKESARRNIIKSNGSSVKLDTIIRRSSRYKASKLTASQSQFQDTESQPVEFVPDSQANA